MQWTEWRRRNHPDRQQKRLNAMRNVLGVDLTRGKIGLLRITAIAGCHV